MKLRDIIWFLALPISSLVALVWSLVSKLRNVLYNRGIITSVSFEGAPYIICIGNLAVGGSGKTPLTEHLIREFAKQFSQHEMAVLSRGYGRKTKGFFLADSTSDAAQIGDEPLQIFQKYGANVTVAVSENRVEGVQTLKQRFPDLKLVLLDDAFQHRKLKADLNIVVSEYGRPFYHDVMLPVGKLRETKSGIKRADWVLFSKVPDKVTDEILIEHGLNFKEWYADQEAFYAGIEYMDVYELTSGTTENMPSELILMTGIVNPEPIHNYLLEIGVTVKKHLEFPDHYVYTESDLKELKIHHLPVLVTEKDAAKLKSMDAFLRKENIKVLVLPMEIDFRLPDKDSFGKIIYDRIAIKNEANR